MKYLILALLLPATAFAEQTEIQKIEARLEELKVIWKEDQGIINAYTKNRTQAVREGSKEYYACLDASKRIQQMEKEASELKAKKTALEQSKGVAVSPVSTSVQEIRSFDLASVKAKADSKKSETLVFKGFYLDMPASDALGLINDYLSLKQAGDAPITTTEEMVKKSIRDNFLNGNSDKNAPYQIFKTDTKIFISTKGNLGECFAVLDSELKVTEFTINRDIRDILFDSKDTPLEEFVQTFRNAYNVPMMEPQSLPLEYMEEVGRQNYYTCRSPKGYELSIWGERSYYTQSAVNSMRTTGQGQKNGSVTLKKIQTETERNKKFD